VKRNGFFLLAMAAAVAVTTAAASGPLKVRTRGTASQQIVMCPDCREEIACATVGDFILGLAVDLQNSKTGLTRLTVHVRDEKSTPVTDATVAITLSMPRHRHRSRVLTARHQGHGRYVINNASVRMTGDWQAEVAATTAQGDTVKQEFAFKR
jgi:anti-sigma factor ChrR (cupin superfamily)